MQGHDRNIDADNFVDESYLPVSDDTSKTNTLGTMCSSGLDSKNAAPLSTSPKKLIDYRKQRAPVSPIDHIDFILSPNRHRTSPLRFFDDSELPSLAISLEDSVGSLSLAETQSCLNDSGSTTVYNEKVEFYLKIPKREQKCQRRESLQSIVSKMQLPNNPKSDRHFVLDPKASSPRKCKAGSRASRRLSGGETPRPLLNCYTNRYLASKGAQKQEETAEGLRFDSVDERHERLKRLSGFCSMRSINPHIDNSINKMPESKSTSSEQVKDFVEQEDLVNRDVKLQVVSGLVSTRHLKEEKSYCTEQDVARSWKSRDSYPFEIVVPHTHLSRSNTSGGVDYEQTSKRKKKGLRNCVSNAKPASRLRRSYSTGEAMNAECSQPPPSPGSDSRREMRRWSSSCDGRHARLPSSSSTAMYTEWKIELMLKTT